MSETTVHFERRVLKALESMAKSEAAGAESLRSIQRSLVKIASIIRPHTRVPVSMTLHVGKPTEEK